ncbi:MAG: guanylate kinase [Hyphomicrobiaceae bacterium]
MADPSVPRISRRGLLLVLSSPSGAGKTTLSKRLLASDPEIQLSVSVTTRPPRVGEIEGRDYFFIDQAEFERRRAAGDLLEWATVHGNSYGTPRSPVEAALQAGRDVLFDIDWQGAQQLEGRLPQDLVRVFVLPPTATALEQRLKTRGQDAPDVVARRLAGASSEISHWPEYDYVIVNAEVDQSFATLAAILTAERSRRARIQGLSEFVRGLQAGLAAPPR